MSTYVRAFESREHMDGIATDSRGAQHFIGFCSVLLLHIRAVVDEALPESCGIGLCVKGLCPRRLRGITELLESCEQLGSLLRLCGGCGQFGMGSGQQLQEVQQSSVLATGLRMTSANAESRRLSGADARHIFSYVQLTHHGLEQAVRPASVALVAKAMWAHRCSDCGFCSL
jgi:hypothetical protein